MGSGRHPRTKGLVLKSLHGAISLNPTLRLHSASKSVYVSYSANQSPPVSRAMVAVISGGGAGHEPAHAGYTGRGMLAASVSGDIFASPSAKQILHTIWLASSSGASSSLISEHAGLKDVLVIINNYTGDRLNFGLAIEKALASSSIHIESVVVADDVSLLRPRSGSSSRASLVGARGLAGNILVCKILSAFAERGEPLISVKQLGDAVVRSLASVGVGLEHCHVPGRAPWGSGEGDGMRMGEQECEIGLGLHNEPGVTRKKMEGPAVVIQEMLELILHSRDHDEDEFWTRSMDEELGDEGVLFVNNLGGMSQLEMGAVLDEILLQLENMRIFPTRIYMSTYMTSLNAPGFSISLLNTSSIQRILQRDSNWASPIAITELIDEPTDAFAWAGVCSFWPLNPQPRSVGEETSGLPTLSRKTAAPIGSETIAKQWNFATISPKVISGAIKSACEAVLRVQKELTRFDTIVGDGDCGETFSAGARAILSCLDSGVDVERMTPPEFVGKLAEVLEDSMGGTIGALFAIFFTALSAAARDLHFSTSLKWGTALETALSALGRHTPAKLGDRTIIDALAPFCHALSSGRTLEEAVKEAKDGAESTRQMQAVLGRAVYVDLARNWNGGEGLPPDPGAWGVAMIFEGFCLGLRANVYT